MSSTLIDLTGGCRTEMFMNLHCPHVSTYIGSRHILLLQLLQRQHLGTAGVVGVGDPGVVRQVHVTVGKG